MADKTKNLGLTKPAQDDYYDVDVFNDNADKVDTAYGDYLSRRIITGNFSGGKISYASAPVAAIISFTNAGTVFLPYGGGGKTGTFYNAYMACPQAAYSAAGETISDDDVRIAAGVSAKWSATNLTLSSSIERYGKTTSYKSGSYALIY